MNQRHLDLQSSVLPSELPWHMDRTRFELVISSTSKRNHTPRPPVLYNIICSIKSDIYTRFREWPYKNVKKRIIAEELIATTEPGGLADYKFSCYNGVATDVMICMERDTGNTKFYFFDEDWQLLRYNKRGIAAPKDFTLPRPKNLDKMFEIAGVLSRGIPYLRVDLYNVDGKIYFGEMTFYPQSGLDKNLLPETELLFGSRIKI